MAVHVNFLMRFPLLCELSLEVREKLAAQMSLRTFSRRELVLNREDVSQGLGFLLEGRLQGVDFTVDGREVGLYFVEAGDYFGELPVVDGVHNAEFVIALSRSQVVFLPRELARRLVFSSPNIAEQMMVRLASRVRAVTAQRTLLSLPYPFQRLCAQLLHLVEKSPEPFVILHVPTQQELAIMINTSRETVTRSFQILLTQNVVARNGSALNILNFQYLKDIAEGRMDIPKN